MYLLTLLGYFQSFCYCYACRLPWWLTYKDASQMFTAWTLSDLPSNNVKITQTGTFMNLQSNPNNWFYGNCIEVYSETAPVLSYGGTELIMIPSQKSLRTQNDACLPHQQVILRHRHHPDMASECRPLRPRPWFVPLRKLRQLTWSVRNPLKHVPFDCSVLIISLSNSYFKNKINFLSGF